MRRAALLLLLVVAVLASCAEGPTVVSPAEPPPPPAAAPLPVVPIRWTNVLAVAEDPIPRKAGAPMGLTSAEGVGLQIASLQASAVIDDPLALTELHFTFKNPEARAIEGRFEMTLPPGATISRFAMKQATGWQEGEVVEREAARVAYEDFLHRRTDPALLEKQAGNRFQARVFPIPASGEKEIIVSYSEEITSARDPYRLYLRGLPRLGRLDLRVLFDDRLQGSPGRRAFEAHESDFLPERDFALALDASGAPGAGRGLRADDLAVARVRPVAEPRPDPVRDLLVLVDTSASRALDLKAQADHLGALLEHVARQSGAEAPVAVACFDQELAPVYVGGAGGFGRREIDAILDRKALGATDLAFALDAAAAFDAHKGKAYHRLLLLTDGIATAGATEGSDFKAELRALREAGVERLDVVVAGGLRDESLLHALAAGGLPHDGLVLDGDLAPRAIAERLGEAAVSGIQVSVAGARWVWPKTLSGIVPGDDVLVYASLPPGAPFEVALAGPGLTVKVPVETRATEKPLLERAAVKAQIERLTRERDDSTDDKARAALKDEIVALSTKHRVLSDLTALLVLETDQDYARFRIDRRALSDILVVGPAGVDRLHRAVPTLQVAEDAPAAAEKAADLDGKADKVAIRQTAAPMQPAPAAPGAPATPEAAAAPPPPPAPPPQPAAGEPAKPSPSPRRSDMEERPAPPEPPPPQAPRNAVSHGAAPRSAPAPAAAPAPQAWSAPSDPPMRGAASAAGPRPRSPAPTARQAPRRVRPQPEQEVTGAAPYEGRFAQVMALIAAKKPKEALDHAWAWRTSDPSDVLALVALGESYEALGRKELAARAYGSIIDLFPSRADLRRFAGDRLERLAGPATGAATLAAAVVAEDALELAIDSYGKAVASRPDHPQSHRAYAYALARAGRFGKAFDAILAGFRRDYPSGRFAGVPRILADDVGILGAAWIRADPSQREAVTGRAQAVGVAISTTPSLRFLMTWETDDNDVDFHIHDGRGGHAFYMRRELESGGALYADITTGYGPECFAIPGVSRAYPYRLQAHYYSRGPMGYGMGKLEIVEHDGRGGLRFDERPYVVMVNHAFVDLGVVTGPLRGR